MRPRGLGVPLPYKVRRRVVYGGGRWHDGSVYSPGWFSQITSYPTLEAAIEKARGLVMGGSNGWRVEKAEVWYGYPPPPARIASAHGGTYPAKYYGIHATAFPPALIITFVKKKKGEARS